MSFEDWKQKLIKITSEQTGRPEDSIKLNDEGCMEYYLDGWHPYFVFRENWISDGEL